MKPVKRFPLKAQGLWGGIQRCYRKKDMSIVFKFNDNIFNSETFSEITLLNFVAQSYADSCLTLLLRMEGYNIDASARENNFCSTRYLPAMFCFRHYLELKLKCLYMVLTRQSFDFNHKLNMLLEEVKQKGFSNNVFDEPINYIENIENGDEAFFRYLISTKFDCVDEINIPMFEFKRIKNFIIDIEQAYNLFVTDKVLKSIKNTEK